MALAAAGNCIADDLQRLNALLNSGQFNKAMKFAREIEDNYIGEPDYDFLYALAAIETDNAEKAIFPLERILMENPDQYRARLELGRAYFLLGDSKAAINEFNQVKRLNPPSNILRTINMYMDALTQQQSEQRTVINGNVSFKFGKNTNINTATSSESVVIGILGTTPLQLDESSRKTRDLYTEKSVNLGVNHPLSNKYKLFANVAASDIKHVNYGQYDLMRGYVKAGAIYVHPKYTLRIPLDYERLILDHITYRRANSMSLEGTYKWAQGLNLQFAAKLSRSGYPDSPLQDEHTIYASLGIDKVLKIAPVMLATSVYSSKAMPRYSNGLQNTKIDNGVRIQGIYMLSPESNIIFAGDFVSTPYNAMNTLYLIRRHDKRATISVGWMYKITKHFTFQTDLSNTRSYSNIEVYDYSQLKYNMGVSYAF